jgi:hypothetical protein
MRVLNKDEQSGIERRKVLNRPECDQLKRCDCEEFWADEMVSVPDAQSDGTSHANKDKYGCICFVSMHD